MTSFAAISHPVTDHHGTHYGNDVLSVTPSLDKRGAFVYALDTEPLDPEDINQTPEGFAELYFSWDEIADLHRQLGVLLAER